MALFCEHESIENALRSGGLLSAGSREKVGTPTRPVLLGWSARSAFQEDPQYAWLSSLESVYLHLPQGLGVVTETIQLSEEPIDDHSECARLLTPLGQWIWALDQMEFALSNGSKGEFALRVEVASRFASRQWHDWYDAPIAALRNYASDERPESARLFDDLKQIAVSVATAHACQPLVDWSEGPSSAELARWHDVFCYASQGLVGARELCDMHAIQTLHRKLSLDFADTSQSLGFSHRSNSAGSVHLCIDAIERALDDLSHVSGNQNDRVQVLLPLIETLIGASRTLAEQCFRIRKNLRDIASGEGHACA